jgi:hypothetical protein
MIPVNFAKGWVRFAPFTINFKKISQTIIILFLNVLET